MLQNRGKYIIGKIKYVFFNTWDNLKLYTNSTKKESSFEKKKKILTFSKTHNNLNS